uniref:Uncharacterized protein n=1 Tax=Daphnia galeata TaxID=27404 RepID=A0A8J2S144_9CRUS|nr:unnamed protein product [Daphnia galeata]
MEDITTKGEKSGAMKDSEIPTVIDFPSSFSVGFERSLPSLEHLFKEYRDAIEEKTRFQLELDHETQIGDDLQQELNYYQRALEHKTSTDQIPQLGAEQLCSIEATHKELTNAIKSLEEQLTTQEKETQAKIDFLEHSAWKMAQTDEEEFKEKLNELQIQFKSEMEVVRQNLRTKENKLKAAKDKAEVEHSKRKEDIRKSLANRMKSDSQHIECRSAELDLRKRAARLEKEIQQLEQQQRSKRKLPLSFTANESPRTGVSPQTPNNSKSNNNKGTLTPHPALVGSAGKQPQSDNLPRGVATTKRQLFSIKRSEYPDP